MIDPFQGTCLKSNYSLRRQLLLSFGPSAVLTTSVVVVFGIIFSKQAGNRVSQDASSVLRSEVIATFVRSTSYVAERFTGNLDAVEGSVQLLVEFTRDRVVGYPEEGWELDEFVPFFDTDHQRNVYPLRMPPAPLDWNFTSNLNESNVLEHTLGRSFPWPGDLPLTTASGVFHMQGSCDPNQTDPESAGYLDGCTEEHNNIETGGVIQPLLSTQLFHRISGDLSALVKPIFEMQEELVTLAYHFVNQGAGASVYFPGHTRPPSSYISEGCDWMRNINPRTGRSLGTEQEMSRCQPKGTIVSSREYNPSTTEWMRALMEKRVDEITWYGPYRDYEMEGSSQLAANRAVFDRKTGELIGAVSVMVHLEVLNKAITRCRVYGDDVSSEIAIVTFDEGTVIADTMDLTRKSVAIPIYQTPFMLEQDFLRIKQHYSTFFDGVWNPKNLLGTYNQTVFTSEDTEQLISSIPIPIPPTKYDASYRPKFLVIGAVSSQVFQAIQEMESEIDDDFTKTILASVLTALVGAALVICVVWFVSRRLTHPLLLIDEIARTILPDITREKQTSSVQSIDARDVSGKTEIFSLVIEFQSLIKNFSGKGPARIDAAAVGEIKNEMSWRSDFGHLYSCLEESKDKKEANILKPDTDEASVTSERKKTKSFLPREEDKGESSSVADKKKQLPVVVPAPRKKNLGRNVIGASRRKAPVETVAKDVFRGTIGSSLFWWLVVLIVLPLTLVNVFICVYSSVYIESFVPEWLEIVEDASLLLGLSALNKTVEMKGSTIELLMREIVRDLHVHTRMSNWLLFGGVESSNVLVDMIEAVEDCKMFPPDFSCPFYSSDHFVCACDWESFLSSKDQCTYYDELTSRAGQRSFWHVQRSDADPDTGTRYSSPGFPEFHSSLPNNTQWWDTTEDLPGSWKGANTSGYETAYDRFRTTSGISVVSMPLSNYKTSAKKKPHELGIYLAFDADGSLTGYTGCDYNFTFRSAWQSSESNFAAKLAPELCPLGKYGYDSRCRDWYVGGRDKYLQTGETMHLQTPYKFASIAWVGMGIVAPLADPSSGVHIGHTLLDFTPPLIRDALNRMTEPLSFLITPRYDASDGDTVVGPNRSNDVWQSADIVDLLFAHEEVSSVYPHDFRNEVLPSMKGGESSISEYMRWEAGSQKEKIYLAYRPVYISPLIGVSPGNFERGVNQSFVLAYSVGVGSSDEVLRRPFREIKESINEDMHFFRVVYNCVVFLVSLIFALYSCMIAYLVTKPVITLLQIMRKINGGRFEGELPALGGGSVEINHLYTSFSRLVKLIRMSNIAFFSGNLKWARDFMSDTLALYQKLDDQKAIGIASNNMGNTLHVLVRDGAPLPDDEQDDQYETAVVHYNKAVEVSQTQFEEATSDEDKTEYAQQLADRLFNRALFGLVAETAYFVPESARASTLADLAEARRLDCEVKRFWIEKKVLLERSAPCYERLLRRAHGLIDFYDDEEVRSVCDARSVVEEADQLLFAAWTTSNGPLFKELTPAGRLQQLEGAAMRIDLALGRTVNAARLAMRSLAEDEYVLESSFSIAAEALMTLLRSPDSRFWDKKAKDSALQDIHRMSRNCRGAQVDFGKSVIFAFEINEQSEGSLMLDEINRHCLDLYDSHCNAQDHIGIVANTVKGDFNLSLCSRDWFHGRQRAVLDLASSSTGDVVHPSLPYALQMIVDSPATTMNDTYIILIVDGYSYDPATYQSAESHLKRLLTEKSSVVHLLILGLDADDDEFLAFCRNLAEISELSFFRNVTLENIKVAFAALGELLSGKGESAHGLYHGLTMEKF